MTQPEGLAGKGTHAERGYRVAEGVGLELNCLGGALVVSAQSCGRYEF